MAKAREIKRARATVAILVPLVLIIAVVVVTGVLFVVLSRGVNTAHAPRTYVEAQASEYQKAIDRDPANVQTWQDYARLLVYAGEYREAEKVLVKARESQPSSRSAGPFMLVEAELLLAEGKYEEALKVSDQLMKEYPKVKRDAEVGLADKVNKRAFDVMRPGEKFLVDTHILRAKVFAALEQWDSVVEETTKALKYDKNAIDVLTLRGNAYAKLGKTEQARDDYERAIEFDYEPAKTALKKLGR